MGLPWFNVFLVGNRNNEVLQPVVVGWIRDSKSGTRRRWMVTRGTLARSSFMVRHSVATNICLYLVRKIVEFLFFWVGAVNIETSYDISYISVYCAKKLSIFRGIILRHSVA